MANREVDIRLVVRDDGSIVLAQAGKKIEQFSKKGKSDLGQLKNAYDDVYTQIVTLGGAIVLAGAVEGAINMGKLGAEVKNVTTAFTRIDDSAELMENLRSATQGNISDLELMRNALIGLDLGATNQQLETFARFARFESIRKGSDELETFRNIISGVLRGSTELLDNFGISLTDLNSRILAMAEAGGEAAGKLTDVERRQLAVAAATDLMKQRLDNLGDSPVTDAEKINQAAVAWENVKDQISQIASPTIASGLGAIAKWLSGAAEAVNAIRTANELEDLVEKSRQLRSQQTPGGGGGVGGGGGGVDEDFGTSTTISRKVAPPVIPPSSKSRDNKQKPNAATSPAKSWTYGPDGWVEWSDLGLGWQDEGKIGQNNLSRTFEIMPGGIEELYQWKDIEEKLIPAFDQSDLENKIKVVFTSGEKIALEMTNAVGEAFEVLGSQIGSEFGSLWDGVFNHGKTMWDRLATSFVTSMTSAMAQIAAKWAAFKIMDMILPGSGSLLGAIFGRASGGPVAPGQPYLVGERGPELFVPTNDGHILPNLGVSVRNSHLAFSTMPSTAFGRAAGGPVVAGQPYMVGERGREVYIPQASRTTNQSLNFNDTINVDGFLPNEIISALKERRAVQREELLQLLTELKKLNRLPA